MSRRVLLRPEKSLYILEMGKSMMQKRKKRRTDGVMSFIDDRVAKTQRQSGEMASAPSTTDSYLQ